MTRRAWAILYFGTLRRVIHSATLSKTSNTELALYGGALKFPTGFPFLVIGGKFILHVLVGQKVGAAR